MASSVIRFDASVSLYDFEHGTYIRDSVEFYAWGNFLCYGRIIIREHIVPDDDISGSEIKHESVKKRTKTEILVSNYEGEEILLLEASVFISLLKSLADDKLNFVLHHTLLTTGSEKFGIGFVDGQDAVGFIKILNI